MSTIKQFIPNPIMDERIPVSPFGMMEYNESREFLERNVDIDEDFDEDFKVYLTKADYRQIFPDIDSFDGDILKRLYLWFVKNKTPFDPIIAHRPFLVFLGLVDRFPHKTLDKLTTERLYSELMKRWYADEPGRWESHPARPLVFMQELQALGIADKSGKKEKDPATSITRAEYKEREKFTGHKTRTTDQMWKSAMWNKVKMGNQKKPEQRY